MGWSSYSAPHSLQVRFLNVAEVLEIWGIVAWVMMWFLSIRQHLADSITAQNHRQIYPTFFVGIDSAEGEMGKMREMGDTSAPLGVSDGEDERTFLVCVISVNKLSPPYPYLSNKSVKSVF
jgi:hypothetical protein